MKNRHLWIMAVVVVAIIYGGYYIHLRYSHFFVHRSNSYGDKITLGEWSASFFMGDGPLRDPEYYESRTRVLFHIFYPARITEETVRFTIPSIF